MVRGTDITEQMNRYRECARHVWNVYFRDAAFDPEHDFINVDAELFFGIVLSEFESGSNKRGQEGFYSKIRVSYEVPPNGLPLLFPTKDADSTVWREAKLLNQESDLRFIGFFDWDTDVSAVRDFRFVRVRAIEVPENAGLGGLDLLIEPELLRFHYDVQAPDK